MKQDGAIQSSKELLGGTPVFAGTRVPIRTLLDYLEEDKSITDFLDDFPTVSHEQVLNILETAKESLVGGAHARIA